MASEDLSAETWLARGIEAYQARRFDEAAEHFEKAVAMDPGSVQAHLALGAVRLTLYKKRPPLHFFAEREISEREVEDFREREKAILAEQNAANWALAENSLKQANELDPENALVVEYLCALYFAWKDPLDETNDRMDEAKQWLERLLELQPEHKYANFHCGMILSGKARKLLPNYGRYPVPPEPDLASLRLKVSPLLEEASRHLSRALTLHGESTGASFFVDDVRSMQAYLADPNKAARDLREKLTEMFSKHMQAAATGGQGGGIAVPARSSETITFTLSPEALAEDREPAFPPNPWRLPVS
jgi:tetratricopeptide (TPR) repeat protein